MNRSIEILKGVGPAKADVLSAAGIKTIQDLLYYFPRRYLDRTIKDSALQNGGYSTLIVRVQSTFLAHGRKSRLMVQVKTEAGEKLTLVFFRGLNYFRFVFQPNQLLVVAGNLEYFSGMQMVHPDFEFLDEDENALLHVGRIVPVYPSTEALKKKGFDSRGFRRMIQNAFNLELSVPEVLPDHILKRNDLLLRLDALRFIHYPDDQQTLDRAIHRLKYEELFLFSVMMHQKRRMREAVKGKLWPLPFGKSDLYRRFIASLPFSLTNEQQKAIQELVDHYCNDRARAYLLQGDVGSGKTVVAVSLALHYLENQSQVALMAPTDVLARQHYRTLIDLLGLHPEIRIDILTGSDKKKAKEQAVARIRSGETNFIVGTHSLIEETVEFESLGLIIIDEQHRFGVGQREDLRKKGTNPDILAMTATPIPRSLCLTVFSDLDLVTLKEKPAGRKEIKTMWLSEDRRPGLYASIRKHVSKGRQCYIVYPIIDESEKSDLKAATAAFEELNTVIFPDFRIELMHGRLKHAEKERIMNDFRRNEIQILVSTTVIEVGIDVANATIMVIEHADRFGLSQLHQLRGRVGRGDEESFCILMADQTTEDGQRRLQAMEESSDGFYLSEVDLQIRGPGELLGLRQHGLPGFRLADFSRDFQTVKQAHTDSADISAVSEETRDLIRKNFEEGIIVFPA